MEWRHGSCDGWGTGESYVPWAGKHEYAGRDDGSYGSDGSARDVPADTWTGKRDAVAGSQSDECAVSTTNALARTDA